MMLPVDDTRERGMAAPVDGSLLQRLDETDGEPRFGLLGTIREFAQERLVASGEADEIRGRHVDYFINLGERAALE